MKLKTFVWLNHPATLEPTGFGPDDEIPEWAASQIGDHCLAPDSDERPKASRTTNRAK